MSKRALAAFLLCAACLDKAKPDYDRCMTLEKSYDVAGAMAACSAAVAADPKSVSGQAAAQKLTDLQSVNDKMSSDRADKAAREADIKRDPPPPPPSSTVAQPSSADVTPTASASASVFEQASALAKAGDTAGARALLEPRVFGARRPSSEEMSLLMGICKAQHDKACINALRQRR